MTQTDDLERVRQPFSAAIYGNVLTLGAVVSPLAPSATRWTVVAAVLATVAATYVAHVAAHLTSARIGRPVAREHVSTVLRDAMPILVSGLGPALILTAGAAGWLDDVLALTAAGLLVVVRLAASGMVARHSSGNAAPLSIVWSGVVLAAVAVAVVVVKIVVTH